MKSRLDKYDNKESFSRVNKNQNLYDDRLAKVNNDNINDDNKENVNNAIDSCPVAAIEVVDEESDE